MGNRFGKARVPGCECTTSFTCRPCLSAAPSWHWTPSAQSFASDACECHGITIHDATCPAYVEPPAPRVACVDCGEEGELTGHQGCQYPRDHA